MQGKDRGLRQTVHSCPDTPRTRFCFHVRAETRGSPSSPFPQLPPREHTGASPGQGCVTGDTQWHVVRPLLHCKAPRTADGEKTRPLSGRFRTKQATEVEAESKAPKMAALPFAKLSFHPERF